MKTTKSIITLLFVLLTAQAAFAWYDPSTQRWLSRDPVGEPGFQVLQSATHPDELPMILPSSSRWINRDSFEEEYSYNLPTLDRLSFDPQNEADLYRFVQNDSINYYDPDGRLP
jgi:hypothetical protein